MRILMLLLMTLLLMFCFSCETSHKAMIHGELTGMDGKAPALAHIHLMEMGGDPLKPLKSVDINKDGIFSAELPQDLLIEVMFTAADYKALILPIIRETKSSVELNVTLEDNEYITNPQMVKITGDWNDFAFSSASPMEKLDDGTYQYQVKSDSQFVAYQLVGLTDDGRSVNGPQYDRLVYDGGGDYRSVVKTENGRATIIFDPAKLKQPAVENIPRVEVLSGGATSEYLGIGLRCSIEKERAQAAARKFRSEFGSTDRYQHDFSQTIAFLQEKIDIASSDDLKKYAALSLAELAYFQANIPDPVFTQIAADMPLDDPMWAIKPMLAPYIYSRVHGPEEAAVLFEEYIDRVSVPKMRAIMLVNLGLMAKRQRDQEKLIRIYEDLKTNHSDVPEVGYYLQQFNPDMRVAVGKKIPEFAFTLLDDKTTISSKSLKGKFYLLDFWATWCNPCVGEMPQIHAAWDNYKDKNFTIVSISFDRQRDDIDKFRKKTWKMPWNHTFLEPAIREQISETFEVDGIPKPILVSPEGVIVAIEAELRGEQLDRTLSRYLN